MRTIALVLALASVPLLGGGAATAAFDNAANARAATEAGVVSVVGDASARRKLRRHRHVYHSYRYSYGYDRPYGMGYYRGVRPGWGYGPDPGDYAWPPFHFKPYW